MRNRTLGWTIGVVFSALAASSASAGWINGWWLYPYKTFVNDTVTRRPWTPTDRGVSISDFRISKLPTNHKGLQVTPTVNKDGSIWVYRWVAIWHMEISDVWRTPGYHTDFIRIAGNGMKQPYPTSVLLQDIYLHDGAGIPILIQDGWFDKITLRDVRVSNTQVCIQLCALNTGRIDQIVIDHCPNQTIALSGRPGAIGTVYVRNSPGLKLVDAINKYGISGARIVYLD